MPPLKEPGSEILVALIAVPLIVPLIINRSPTFTSVIASVVGVAFAPLVVGRCIRVMAAWLASTVYVVLFMPVMVIVEPEMAVTVPENIVRLMRDESNTDFATTFVPVTVPLTETLSPT